ncbi:TnsA-like heteromeric transposase endonuclease subunit [Mycobacterium intracellulare]|uniref:TnsA-like heteromeric transposase endonuclease subunit n=1 Tax=Mycobacterium intracellulare subsp. chimaera TaxID=222805 RepID=A0ABT7P824_MYCIT|nr:TnsA-like heteromeric transposase endonuclease subunit [Mycobacterium intracellulare]MCA2312546.1 TnsA-like heteromeric transposase endonuclease subunit [Mycobacterium intracellulare subsp. chimaera]MCA2354868.1 TnsA-like heteromeric transposase endonuclease subunit [Mycobacterium intracellulare subsp. chimaera]MCF1815880.1 TnsA-like heteromeric transposase endonuclease subunit [Mycobacterium intracellulare subsp. intracellulare]MCV7326982.1 TnsA-like heteromeric transposase endonuclease sub
MSRIGAAAQADRSGSEQVIYLPAEGSVPCRIDIGSLATVQFEHVRPVRSASSYKGQKNYIGEWWCATTTGLIAFESWTERDFLISADYDRGVIGISVQPFTFQYYSRRKRKLREHTPDVFLRLRDGTARVIDVRPDQLIDEDAAESFAATRSLCGQVGWQYRRVGDLPEVLLANLRWLAGYRNKRVRNDTVATRITDTLQQLGSAPIGELADTIGERILVLPTLYHLMWAHEVYFDIARSLLNAKSIVRAAVS